MKNNTLTLLFFGSIVVISIGAIFRIQHYPYAVYILFAGILAYISFIASALLEVNNSDCNKADKITWSIGLILCSTLAGILYIAFGRRKFVS